MSWSWDLDFAGKGQGRQAGRVNDLADLRSLGGPPISKSNAAAIPGHHACMF